MNKLEKGQKGFTLIELMIAIGIAALITVGITAATMQILTINHRASNHMIAVRQVQQAGKEVSKDALQAQSVNASESSNGFPLTLTWDEWGTNQTNTIVYDFTDMPSGLKQLERMHTFNGTEQATALPVVAQYIDDTIDSSTGEARTRCEWDPIDGVLTFTVTARVGTEIETRIYEIEPRPD